MLLKVDLRREASAEVDRLSRGRSFVREGDDAARDQLDADGPWATVARRNVLRQRLGRRVLSLWRVAYDDASGRIVESTLVPVALVAIEPSSTDFDVYNRDWFNADLQAHISSSREAWRHAVDETIRQFTSTRVSRERAIAAARAAADPSAFQPGLFDRRAARAHLAHMATRADSEGDLAARLKAIAEAGAVSLRPPQLLLVVTP